MQSAAKGREKVTEGVTEKGDRNVTGKGDRKVTEKDAKCFANFCGNFCGFCEE
ncbi:MAG: hypothetical protein KGZ97_09370 [Bacteroidetes bacterium]|nr:hypothetical protein [Bacteroidota bacterium]